LSGACHAYASGSADEKPNAGEQSVALDQAGITVLRDSGGLAASTASERSRLPIVFRFVKGQQLCNA
jgi:hypothetical protein